MNIYPTEQERLLEAYGVATLREFMLAEMDDACRGRCEPADMCPAGHQVYRDWLGGGHHHA